MPYEGRLFAVGRLDKSSEGLLLVTNDGPLADLLTHPRYGVPKTYRVEVAGTLDREQLARLQRGVHLAEGPARAKSVRVLRRYKQSTLLEIVLAEGKNREIRRILAKVGHKVMTLKRTAIGDVKLRDLKPGEFRPLSRQELKSLEEAKPTRRKRPPRRATVSAIRRPAMAVMLATTIGMVVPVPSTVERSTSRRLDTDERLGTMKTSS